MPDSSERRALAERHVAMGRQMVEEQREKLARIRERGGDTSDAETMLALFEKTLALFEEDLALIRSEKK